MQDNGIGMNSTGPLVALSRRSSSETVYEKPEGMRVIYQKGRGTFNIHVERGKGALSRRLHWLVVFLQATGFYPLIIESTCLPRPFLALLSRLHTLLFFCLTTLTFGYTLYISMLYADYNGTWDIETVSAVITALKPLQCIINFGGFGFLAFRHQKFLLQLDKTDGYFRRQFRCYVNARSIVMQLLVSVFVYFSAVLLLRMVQFFVQGEQLGVSWIADVSLVYVPILNVWYVVPIIYFRVVNRVTQHWARQLKKRVYAHTHKKSNRSVSYYFDSYCQLCSLSGAIDHLFNVFLLLTVVRCIVVIAFTLYFCTEAEMRLVMRPVLEFKVNSDDDKYHVFLFAEKVRTQHGWAVSFWRAIPVERSFLFTFCSIILTYFALILKLKPAVPVEVSPMANQSNLTYV